MLILNHFENLSKPLLYEGHEIGWGQCSLCADQNKTSIFKISDGFSGMKIEHVRRHFRTNHATEEEKQKAKADREAKRDQSSQRPIRQSLNF